MQMLEDVKTLNLVEAQFAGVVRLDRAGETRNPGFLRLLGLAQAGFDAVRLDPNRFAHER